MNGSGERHRQSVNIFQIIHVMVYGRKNMRNGPIGDTAIKIGDLSLYIIGKIPSILVIHGSHNNF